MGDPSEVNRAAMMAALVHRGPDADGEYECALPNGTLWLGHRRLSIVDLSERGRQPMRSQDGRFVLVFNGMIYNYRALRGELIQLGHRFLGNSDTEVLLTAWQEWGEKALPRLRGMFAFAIWDATEACLWLARDRLGEKPLYYVQQSNRLLFASEIRTLLASDIVPRVADPEGIDSFLAWGSISQPHTPIRGVRRLDAGELIQYRKHRLTTRKYWSLEDISEGSSSLAADEVVPAIRAAIDEAIGQCMTADVPVGLLLSGGIDSTAILARLKAQGYDNVSTFSVLFNPGDASIDEREWSAQAASRFRSDHHPQVIDESQARDLIPEALAAMDSPSKDGVNHYMVLQAIARSGFKVAITGQGADEFFYGYGNHAIYRHSLRLAHLRIPSGLARAGQRLVGKIWPDAERPRKITSLFTSGDPEQLAYIARHVVFLAGELDELRGNRRPWPAYRITKAGGFSPLERLYRMEASNLLCDQLLRNGDQMSMARSLELRTPFVDHPLVEILAALPAAVKLGSGGQKPLLVEAVDDPLVRAISQRPKVGFEIPMRRWITGSFAPDPIDASRLGMEDRVVRQITRAGRQGKSFTRYWSLIVLNEWMRRNGVAAA